MDLAETMTHTPVTSGETTPGRRGLLLTNITYEVEESGHRTDTPVFHVRSRDEAGQLHTFTIEGFRPYFGIDRSVLAADPGGVCDDRRVMTVSVDCDPSYWRDHLPVEIPSDADAYDVAGYLSETYPVNVEHDLTGYTTLTDEPVARVYVRTPSDVGGDNGMRELFETTYEADVPFERRFMISTGISRGFEADVDNDRLVYENHSAESGGAQYRQDLDACDPPDVEARMCVFDIEVAASGGFPEPHRARDPITAITAYDSYDDSYALFGLTHGAWADRADEVADELTDELASQAGFPDQTDSDDPELADYWLVSDETELLETFHDWVLARDPDLITGWNASGNGGFDIPYLIQRSYVVQAGQIRDYCTHSNPAVWSDEYNGEQQTSFKLAERCTLDLLEAYSKTQFRELDSKTLDAVANAELGYGKTDLASDELNETWRDDPVTFFSYNVRDTQATAEIEAEVELLSLYENLRRFTGAMYETASNNGPMLDTLFLRRADEDGLILPTNEEADEDVYHGAKVFDPIPGVHANSVYPDLSSLYPNLFAMLNLGTETIIGNEDALADSEYTTDDCYQFPVDNREFAVVEKGEPIDHVDRDEYKGVKTPAGGTREMFDAQYDWLYVVKPEVRESFITSTIDELISLKNQYSGDLYSAVKRITNSCYGVIGDSASGGVGFRLYDRRVAEGITLAGRETITHTAETFTDYLQENHDDEARLVAGDSVPATEPVLIRGEQGRTDIVPIQDLEGRAGDVEVWSEQGFTTVNDVIKKPNRKDTYVTRTKSGIVHTTEDHGLIEADGTEVRPVDVDEGREMLHRSVGDVDVDRSSFTNKRAWVLGLFAAEGSCGIYESDRAHKASWAINNQNRDLLERAQRNLESEWGLQTRIAETMVSSDTLKLQLSGNRETEPHTIAFREMLYEGTQKRVPRCILNADKEAMRAFLEGYHAGDGHYEINPDGSLQAPNKDFDQMETKHEQLAAGIAYLLKQLGYDITVRHTTREKSDGETETYYRVMQVQWHLSSETEVRSVEQYEEDCEYVYDLETENHHFQAGVGSLIVHNTDSCVTSMPNAPTLGTAKQWASEAVEHVEASYDEFVQERFGFAPDDTHRLAVELENLSSRLFFMRDELEQRQFMGSDGMLVVEEEDSAVKKRYAELVVWDDDDGWIDTDYDDTDADPLTDELDRSTLKHASTVDYDTFETGPMAPGQFGGPHEYVSVSGFEYVRSDSAQVTRDAQKQVLTDVLLSPEPLPLIETYLQEIVTDIKAGEYPVADLGRPKGISQSLDEYGFKDYEDLPGEMQTSVAETDGGAYRQTPSPTYRGAKYVDDHFEWEEIGAGSKPLRLYIETVRSGTYPAAYQYDTYPGSGYPDPPEVGRPVDAIAIDRPERLPDEFVVDTDVTIEKELQGPIEPILETLGRDWDDVLDDGHQTGLASFC